MCDTVVFLSKQYSMERLKRRKSKNNNAQNTCCNKMWSDIFTTVKMWKLRVFLLKLCFCSNWSICLQWSRCFSSFLHIQIFKKKKADGVKDEGRTHSLLFVSSISKMKHNNLNISKWSQAIFRSYLSWLTSSEHTTQTVQFNASLSLGFFFFCLVFFCSNIYDTAAFFILIYLSYCHLMCCHSSNVQTCFDCESVCLMQPPAAFKA